MTEHRRRILDMLATGKITTDEADALLSALPDAEAPAGPDGKPAGTGKYMRIEVTKPGHDGGREKKVNIRVPVAVLRSGLKLGSLMRGFKDDGWGGRWSERLKARGLDIDFDHFDTAQLDALLGDGFGDDLDIREPIEQPREHQPLHGHARLVRPSEGPPDLVF